MAPSSEEFLAWRESPVSQWIFKAVKASAQAQKAHWLTESWEGAKADPLLLCELRTRADAYTALEETTYEGWCDANGDDPVTD
jgi:hypothetical protein